MEALKLYNSASVVVDIDSLDQNVVYRLNYTDEDTGDSYTAFATSDENGQASFTLDSHYSSYTGRLSGKVYDSASVQVYEDVIDVVRPYCNLNKIQSKFSISYLSAVDYEKVARYIINTFVAPFSYQRLEKEFVGNGIGYLPTRQRIEKIYKVYENEELVFDYTKSYSQNLANFEISKDKTSIVASSDEPSINRVNYGPLWSDRFLIKTFALNYEYIIDADYGWKFIPSDIQQASELLIQDIMQNNLKYINRYIESFDNEDFKIKFAKEFYTGTGNNIVDKILSKYESDINIGVL